MEILLIIVAVLKILGFILLGLLAVIVFLLALILFVPVRYRAEGRGIQNYQAKVRITWLFRMLQMEGSFTKADAISISVKIFGFPFWSTEKKEKKEKKQESRKRKTRPQAEAEVLQKPLPKKQLHTEEPEEGKKYTEEAKTIRQKTEKEIEQKSMEQEKRRKGQDTIPEKIEKQAESRKVIAEETEESATEHENQPADDTKESIKPTVRRIKLAEIQEEPLLEEELLEKEKAESRKARKNKKDTAKEETKEEEKLDAAYLIHMPWEKKKALLQLCLHFFKRAAKQILPRRVRLEATIGTPDPASTGYLLGIAGVLRGAFGEVLKIQGDFQRTKLDGSFFIQGRLYFGFLAVAGARFIFSRPVWHIIQLWRKG